MYIDYTPHLSNLAIRQLLAMFDESQSNHFLSPQTVEKLLLDKKNKCFAVPVSREGKQ